MTGALFAPNKSWPGSMNPTIDYYNRHAAAFFRETTEVEMTALQRRFTTLVCRRHVSPDKPVTGDMP